jgi:hypothetical protein
MRYPKAKEETGNPNIPDNVCLVVLVVKDDGKCLMYYAYKRDIMVAKKDHPTYKYHYMGIAPDRFGPVFLAEFKAEDLHWTTLVNLPIF